MTPDNLRWEQDHGSGLQRLLGYRLVAWDRTRATMVLHVDERHLNRAGLVHGGVLTTLLDSVSGYAGCWCPEPGRVRRVMTLSLTTNYLAPAHGPVLRAEGQRVGGGRRTFFTTGTVHDQTDELVAMATGTFRYENGSEDEQGVPR